MGLVKRNPVFNDRFLDEFFGLVPASRTNAQRSTLPAVNIKETEEDYQLELAAPGMRKEDFRVEVNNGVLTVSATHQAEQNEEKEGYTRREFHYTSFERSFVLPDTANDSDIKAKYENGILHLIVPKKEEAKPKPARRIKIG
ncbi:MAG: Hsp20/alpha crystallin family protein [Bacteroidetes bacterium]|nr:MAG: Hsp20/alpha crystallin family protein [Bacteroidota bacterium]